MYFNILKKDLKRKKTMNCILLLFVILSTMFSASSVNNIMTVIGGLDYYFEKAGMTDYYLISRESDGKDTLSELLENEGSVTEYQKENTVFCAGDNFLKNNEKLLDLSNPAMMISVKDAKLNYFDSNNDKITDVDEGKIYTTNSFAKKAGLEKGDTFDFKFGEISLTFEFAGIVKDAFLGGEMMGNARFLINDSDYQKIISDDIVKQENTGGIFYVNTDDVAALELAVAESASILFDGDISIIKMTYMMSILVAGLLLAMSICLILVSFVVLRFTISFTVAEEFREIGVMKAIGLKNKSIRVLYLAKYLGISVIGAVIGYAASVPFGNILLASVSKNMVLGNDRSVITGILCSIAVVGIILLFCWRCTAKIKKMSPIDAVRSGQTGERFHKKSLMHLSKSKLGTTGFLSLNDVLSSPKQYGIITVVLTICALLVMILANTANTLNSEKFLRFLDTTKSDVYYNDSKRMTDVIQGRKTLAESLEELENQLADNGMPANVYVEVIYKIPIKSGDKQKVISFSLCHETSTDEYTYSKGTPPRYANEIAVSNVVAEKMNADIGDTVQLTIDGKEDDYIITALFQSTVNLGENGRLHESVFPPDSSIAFGMGYQIDFDDHPDKKEIDRRIEEMKKIFDTEKIMNAADYVKDTTGASDMIAGAKNFALILSLIIIIMISVLMERSFIAKEKSEIALMKAIGFKNNFVYAHRTARFFIVGIISSVLAALLCKPATKLIMDPIFAMTGATAGISYEIRPVEIFVIYPLIIVLAALMGVLLTSLYTRSIKASDTSNIE